MAQASSSYEHGRLAGHVFQLLLALCVTYQLYQYGVTYCPVHGVASDYWRLGLRHSFRSETMPVHLNLFDTISIVQHRSYTRYCVCYGLTRAICTDIR